MIRETRGGAWGRDTIRDESQFPGTCVDSVPGLRLAIGGRCPRGCSDCPAGLKSKAGQLSFPLLGSAVLIGHDEFRLGRGQLGPGEWLGADAQTLLSQQKRFSPSIRRLCVWGEQSCAHTKLAAVFFKWTVRDPGKGRTESSHSPWCVFIKNIFTSVVWSVCFRG